MCPDILTELLAYIKELKPEGKAKAAEYVWRTPDFAKTPVRSALETRPWFAKVGGGEEGRQPQSQF